MVFEEVCQNISFKGLALAQNFLHFVSPNDYEIADAEYAEMVERYKELMKEHPRDKDLRSDYKEFIKEYPSCKAYNEKAVNNLVEHLKSGQGNSAKVETISGSFIPPMKDEMRDLKQRIWDAKTGERNQININTIVAQPTKKKDGDGEGQCQKIRG